MSTATPLLDRLRTQSPGPDSSWLHDPDERSGRDRRTHERLAAHDLEWLKSVRLKFGASLKLLDLSAGGALVESATPLRPGSTAVLTITGRGYTESASFRVLRCEVARVNGGVVYRGACVFERMIALPGTAGGDDAPADRLAADPAAGHLATDPAADRLVAGPAADRLLEDPAADHLVAGPAADHPAVRVVERPAAVRVAERPAAVCVVNRPAAERVVADRRAPERVAAHPAAGQPRTSPSRRDDSLVARVHEHHDELEQAPGVVRGAADRPEGVNEGARLPDVPAAAPAPAVGSGWSKIVVRYMDGRLLKGFSQDFHASRQHFHLSPSIDGVVHRPVLVPISRLKAVFFVRDFEGRPERVKRQAFEEPTSGRRIEITFLDDEVLVGATLGYRPDGTGFFLTPADTTGNNLRVFVIPGAIRHIRYL
jgi:hypothetical protein